MEEDECNIGLGLAIGGGQHFTSKNSRSGGRKPPVRLYDLFPHRRKEEEEEEEPRREKQHEWKNIDEEEDTMSAKDTSRDGGNDQVETRKKLRLTEEQLTLLENSFREHTTLNQVTEFYIDQPPPWLIYYRIQDLSFQTLA